MSEHIAYVCMTMRQKLKRKLDYILVLTYLRTCPMFYF